MGEIKTKPLKATLVEDAFKSDDVAGCYSFEEKPADQNGEFWGWFKARCPCGCGSYHRLPIGLKTKPPNGVDPAGIKATWEWDGNVEVPTLTPSIHHKGHWHGHVNAGMWESC